MERTFDSLFAETTKARQNAHLIQLVYRANSPTDAENTAKEFEYPSSLVRETRLLAVMKRDYKDAFNKTVFFLDKGHDPWRYFDCTYDSFSPVQHDETGILAVKLDFLLPPLFWAYALYNSDEEKLFSFEDGSLGEKTYHIIVGNDSRSIPAGLKLHVYGIQKRIQFEHSLYSQTSFWTIERMALWPTGAYFWKNKNFPESACFCNPSQGLPKQYGLIICDKLERNTDSPDQAEQYSTFVVEGKYRIHSPWHERERFSKEAGVLISDPKEHAPDMMEAKSPLSIEFHTARCGMRVPEESHARSLEDVVKSMFFGLPKEINPVETLKRLFGFKSPHMPCYNKNNLLPLWPHNVSVS